MLCSVLPCSVLFCHVLFCHAVFRRVRRGREAGNPGFSGTLGTTGGLAAAVCRVGGWPGGLFLKSNNPNLSGGGKRIGNQCVWLSRFFAPDGPRPRPAYRGRQAPSCPDNPWESRDSHLIHPACRGRQTPSCPENPRESRDSRLIPPRALDEHDRTQHDGPEHDRTEQSMTQHDRTAR